MSNVTPIPPLPPELGDDDARDVVTKDDVTVERGDERVLDPDANDDLIDSAEADRLAVGDESER